MSRVRRRTHHVDVHVDLGDPLPLPYKIRSDTDDTNANIKIEDDEDTAVDSKNYEPIILKKHNEVAPRPSTNTSRNRVISDPKGTDNETNFDLDTRKNFIGVGRPERIRKEILQNKIALPRNITRNRNTALDDVRRCLQEFQDLVYSPQYIGEEILSEMQNELWSILEKTRRKIAEKDVYITEDVSYLEAENQTQASIELLEELGRLQSMEPDNSRSPKIKFQTPSISVQILLGLLTIFFVTSFIVSGLNYGYCYNSCST